MCCLVELMEQCITQLRMKLRKWSYQGFWLNVFPPLERMKFTFPFLKKMPVFLPFCWVARWFFAIVTKPDKVLRKIRYVVRASREMEE